MKQEILMQFARLVKYYCNSSIMPVEDSNNEDIATLFINPIKRLVAIYDNQDSLDSNQMLTDIVEIADQLWYAIEQRSDIRCYIKQGAITVPKSDFYTLLEYYNIPISENLTWELLHTIAGKITLEWKY